MSGAEPPLEAVTLDVWYTLLYQTAEARRRYEVARAQAWIGPLRELGLSPRAAAAAFRAAIRAAKARDARGEAWGIRQQVDGLRAATGTALRAAEVTRRMNAALAAAQYRAAPQALGALERLRDSGRALALVSNVLYEDPGAMRALLRRAGLTRRVDAVVLSSELGAGKPSPRPLRAALDQLGVAPARALHVGDQPVDVVAADRAGMPAIRYVGLRRYWPSSHPVGLPVALRGTPQLPSWTRFSRETDRWVQAARAARRRRLGSTRRP